MNWEHFSRWIISVIPLVALIVVVDSVGAGGNCMALESLDIWLFPVAGFFLPISAFQLAPSHKLLYCVVSTFLVLGAAYAIAPACDWQYLCNEVVEGCVGYPGPKYRDNWLPYGFAAGLLAGFFPVWWRNKNGRDNKKEIKLKAHTAADENAHTTSMRNEAEIKEGIKKLFRDALCALAASAEEQVRFTEPADVPFEIMDDYIAWVEPFINHFKNELDSEAVKAILILQENVDSLPESVFCETNILSMQQPEWDPIREYAQYVLALLGWPNIPPEPFIKKSNGVYHRP